jgi:hypothetical protein
LKPKHEHNGPFTSWANKLDLAWERREYTVSSIHESICSIYSVPYPQLTPPSNLDYSEIMRCKYVLIFKQVSNNKIGTSCVRLHTSLAVPTPAHASQFTQYPNKSWHALLALPLTQLDQFHALLRNPGSRASSMNPDEITHPISNWICTSKCLPGGDHGDPASVLADETLLTLSKKSRRLAIYGRTGRRRRAVQLAQAGLQRAGPRPPASSSSQAASTPPEDAPRAGSARRSVPAWRWCSTPRC